MDVVSTIENHLVDEGVAIWWLGGPSVALKSHDFLVYINLLTGACPLPEFTKAIPDVLDPDQIRLVDAVLSTHSHLDHCHHDSLMPIYRNTSAMFVGPSSSVSLFRQRGFEDERIAEVAPSDTVRLHSLIMTALPSQDWEDAAAVIYLLQVPDQDITIFESGDSRYFRGFKEIGKGWKIHLALINYGQNPPEMPALIEHRHAVRAVRDLQARIIIPKHWDIWKEFQADPSKLVKALQEGGIRCEILEVGGMFHLHGSSKS